MFLQKLDELRKSWATHKSYLAKDRLVCGLVTWEGILQRVGFFVLPQNQQFAPENWKSQNSTSVPTIHFQGLC